MGGILNNEGTIENNKDIYLSNYDDSSGFGQYIDSGGGKLTGNQPYVARR
jgi:hypothetical protein